MDEFWGHNNTHVPEVFDGRGAGRGGGMGDRRGGNVRCDGGGVGGGSGGLRGGIFFFVVVVTVVKLQPNVCIPNK